MEIEDIQRYATYALAFIAAVTPTFRALMALAHASQRYALGTQHTWDDAAALRFVQVTESICGTLAKISSFLPRITLSSVKR